MTSYWVFQANPSTYDIDGALAALSEIRWRVPQYTGAISPGDGVVIWRSGRDAGIVGVGRVTGYPAELAQSAAEQAFDLTDGEHVAATRVSLAVAPSPLVAKADVAALPGWADHKVVVAPRGTVFPITDQQWAALEPHLPALPAQDAPPDDALPPVLAWQQRRRDTYPLPGGYSNHLVTLHRIFTHVETSAPTRGELEMWFRDVLDLSEMNAQLGVGFLLRIGLLVDRGSTVALGDEAVRWLRTQDNERLIALLHSRIRFIGELLAEATEPCTDGELLDISNRYYGSNWQTKAQIHRRRGWLRSAGMLTETDDGRLITTAAGRALIERLDLHPRTDTPPPPRRPLPPPAGAPVGEPPPGGRAESGPAAAVPDPGAQTGTSAATTTTTAAIADGTAALIDRLRATASDGAAAEQFERETTEAFRRLGFRSEWLGRSGRTDVLLQAELGRDHRYTVVIDCKSSGRGNVSNQIDWDTIDEHRAQHHADHAAIVAGSFGGGRLPDRAQRHDAALLTVEHLADLLVQHERVPLGLDTYRLLFTSATADDAMAAIAEVADEAERRIRIMRAVVDLIDEYTPRSGALSARDLELLLTARDEIAEVRERDIQPILDVLASPLVGALDADDVGTFRRRGSSETAAATLRLLADVLVGERTTEDDAAP